MTLTVENTIRPSALGKKNWLFIGDAKIGDRAAVFYTLLRNCRRHGVDAHAYLLDLFTRLPSLTNQRIKEITPAAWAEKSRRRGRLKRVKRLPVGAWFDAYSGSTSVLEQRLSAETTVRLGVTVSRAKVVSFICRFVAVAYHYLK